MSLQKSFSVSDEIALSPEELAGAASMTLLDVDVLSAKGGQSRIRRTRSAQGWSFDTASLDGHVRARGAFEKGHVVLLTVMRGGDATICGVPLQDGVVLMLPDGMEIAASIRSDVAYSASVLPVEMWAGIVETATGATDPAALRRPHAICRDRDGFAPIANSLAATLADFSSLTVPDGSMPGTYLDYLGTIASTIAGGEGLDRYLSRSLRHRQKQAWRAEELIHARLQETFSIMSLCREIGISRRQLEYAFLTTFNVGPSEYVRLLRLNEIRRHLKSGRAGSRTVTDIAMEAGVTHLGRFAQSYRQLFSETPLQTLRGSRKA